jgi:hypothetical protein
VLLGELVTLDGLIVDTIEVTFDVVVILAGLLVELEQCRPFPRHARPLFCFWPCALRFSITIS